YECWDGPFFALFSAIFVSRVCRFCRKSQKKMQNEAGEYVDMYTPRKCSVTNSVIAAKDHASVQINVGEIDETGRYTGTFKTYALCGKIRQEGEADDALTRLCCKHGIINKYVYPHS
ncbi:unnamed protein product, partial [Porites evermanni]